MKNRIKGFVRKILSGLVACGFVSLSAFYAIDIGTQTLKEDETTCTKLSATLSREEHRYTTQYTYKDKLNANPFKYLSKKTVISYVNRITKEVLAEITVVMKFKYNEKTHQAECISTASSSMAKDSEYSVNVSTRKANSTTEQGGGLLSSEFKYRGESQDKLNRQYICSYFGDIEVLDS